MHDLESSNHHFDPHTPELPVGHLRHPISARTGTCGELNVLVLERDGGILLSSMVNVGQTTGPRLCLYTGERSGTMGNDASSALPCKRPTAC